MTPYRLGIYEKAMPASLNWKEKLASARRMGFDYVEMSIDETEGRLARLQWDKQQIRRLRDDMEEEGIPIGSICLSGHRKYPLGSRDGRTRAKSLEIMSGALDLACALGIRVIQLAGYDVYYEEGGQDTREMFRENLQTCVTMAASAGVPLGFETMETPFMDTVAKAMAYVHELNSPWLGVYPDLGNMTNAAHLYGGDVEKVLETGKGHLFALHLKETREGLYRNMRFGEGWVDFDGGIRKAMELGVRRFVMECWDDGCPDWEEKLAHSAAWIRERIGRQ